jgi:parallel beta helix pectate lyase-like protein
MRSPVTAALVVLILLVSVSSCTNPMRDTVEAVVQQSSTAEFDLNFHNNAGIADDSVLVITFSESMNPQTLELGGVLAGESDGGVWEEDDFPNDRLIISPETSWTQGGNRTLTVAVDDLQTYPSAEVSLSYGVLNGVVYVHPDGSDTNYGTYDFPKATLEAAIDDAEAAYDSAEVWVAEGTYELSSTITISKDLTLLGGFSETDWAVRETDQNWAITGDHESAYPTELRFPSLSGTVTVSVYEAAGTPVIDGFTIVGPTGTESTVVQVYDCTASLQSCSIEGALADSSIGVVAYVADVTIARCSVDGGSTNLSTGVFSYQASATISDSLISGGTGQQTSAVKLIESPALIQRCNLTGGSGNVDAAGIYVEDGSDAIIRNNLINAGTGTSTFGIWVKASDPKIQNNIINGGGASLSPDSIAEGIYMGSGSSTTIENNIIAVYAPSTPNVFAIAAADIASRPVQVRNNCIFNIGNLDYVYLDIDGAVECVTVVDLNAQSFAAANVADDPLIVWGADWTTDWLGTWYSTGGLPAAITVGGADLSSDFTDDILGELRTAPWSIGAFEF